jgi:hypothetical protein
VTTVRLLRENHQVTAFRFRLDRHGKLESGSMNSLYKELRVATR